MTPNWAQYAEVIIVLLTEGKHEAREEAKRELRRMAQLADKYVELAKKGKVETGR